MNYRISENKIVSFFGHSQMEINNKIITELESLIENLILKENATFFYFGGFGDFDDICWQIVTRLKVKYPYIKRIFCLWDSRHLRISKRPKYLKDEDYEEFIYLTFFEYWYTRIYFRNCAMIDDSDFIIFYVKPIKDSGAYKAFKYAKIKHKEIFNLFEET